MFKTKLWSSVGLIVVASILLSACTTSPEVIQVEVTREVQVEGETMVETETIVVTATPEPEPAEEPMEQISPDFKNPDTYIVVAGAGEPETMDPAWTYETAGGAIQDNIYEGMIWFNRERTDEFIPVLATDWGVNEAGDVWTFQVREGVTFHQGGTLEPHDVAYSLHRALLQDRIDGPHWMTLEAFLGVYTIEDLAMSLSGVESFEEVSDADLVTACEMVKEAIVADDEAGTVTYNLNTPTPWFLAMLAQTFMGSVLDMEWMAENGDWDGSCDNWVDYHNPAAQDTILFDQANGTGPYMLDHWTPGEEIVMVANENYWRTEPMWEGGPSGPPSIKRVVVLNINEWGTRRAMFEAGDGDFIYTPSQYRPQLEPYYKTICYPDESCEEGNSDGYIQAHRDMPLPAMTPAQFNWNINVEGGNPYIGSGELDGNGIPPDFFSDIHVRRAFNYCFDFDAMIQEALNGEGMQAQGPIIAGMMGYREGEAPLFSYDPAKCEEEFKLAFDGQLWDSGFYMQLAYNTGNDTRRLTSEILEAGIEAVNPNFDVSVVGMPWPVLLNSRRAQKLPIYVGGWIEDFHDPHNWVHPFLHSQGAYGRVVNMPEEVAAEFDALIEEAASYTTVEERRPIYEELQLKAQEEVVMIWMYQPVGRYHLQESIKGFYFNPAYQQKTYSYIYALSKEAP
ncbi:MAG: ABC transporter substrate-binding protein [Chloroflexota bacterium]|nr:ABC transporter substrate-binding protein [Chloroflexota bacterium]